MSIQKKTEGRDLEEYLQEVWDSLEPAWDKSKFDMKQGYDSEYECDCITITSKDNDGVYAKIYVDDYEGKHPVAFDVVYRYPGDKGVGIMGTYEFQSTDFDETAPEIFDYFDEVAKKASESLEQHIDLDRRGDAELCADDPIKLRRDINSRGYFVDDKGFYNVYVGASFKGKFASVEDAAEVGYTLVESKKSESKQSEKASVICSICNNPTDDPIWGEGNRAFCKDCYGDGADFKHGKTKFVVGMMISLDGVKQYIRELKPRTFVGQSVDTGKEFSLPISSLNRASILYDPRNESKKSESVSSMVKKILNDKPEVMLTDDAVTEYDDYDEMLDDLEGEQDYIHIGSNGNNEDMIFRYNDDKDLIVVGDLDVDRADANAALSLVQDFVDGKLKLASSGEYDENSDYIAIIDGMTYTAYVYIRGGKDESNGGDKGNKNCKDKGCEGSDEKCGGDNKSEAKKSEGLPPKRLGSKRQYRSRADLINKMKQLGAVEITTSKQFNDIKNSQWLHTAGYALDTNGNLVAQSYYGDKDGKWYYTSTRNFDGDYLPESKQHENRTKEEEVTDIFKGMKEWATRWTNFDKDRKTLADNLDLGAVQDNMFEIIEILDRKFEWDGYGFKYPVAFDYSEEDDGARDEADADQWNTCYDACAEIAELIGIPDDGNTIGAMNEYFWEEVEQTWSSNESRTAESKKSESKQNESNEMTEEAVCKLIDELGLVVDNKWYDGNKSRPVFDCRDKFDELGETVCVFVEPPYEARVWFKNVNPRVNHYTEGIETLADLKTTLKEFFHLDGNESKKSESLSLKQKELKDMVRYGEAEDITTISDAEAKELRKKGIELVGVSRGTYGMNGALLRDNEGKKYAITARSSNLFYFV